MSSDRYVDEVKPGEVLDQVDYPITVYRLVMEAGANRDFNSIHHNTRYAQSTGAPDMYANTLFLMGMWERLVRDWTGPGATIDAIRRFRMGRFNVVGHTTTVSGTVIAVDPESRRVTIEVRCADEQGVTVGPGEVDVTLPVRP